MADPKEVISKSLEGVEPHKDMVLPMAVATATTIMEAENLRLRQEIERRNKACPHVPDPHDTCELCGQPGCGIVPLRAYREKLLRYLNGETRTVEDTRP